MTETKLECIIHLHRIKLKEIKLPKISRIYNKFAWKDEIEINQNFNTKNIKD